MTSTQFIRQGHVMTRVARCWVVALLTTSSIGLSPATQAAGYNPITHQAQSKLATLGFNPGTLDGIQGNNTSAAIKAYQRQAGLPATGQLDSATLDKLSIGISVDKAIEDWRALPTQTELDQLFSNPANDPNHPYTDYRPYAPSANLDLPGKAILAAMHGSADTFGSRRPGQPKYTKQGYEYMVGCVKTQYPPTHWSDLTIHYYCQMSKPRACYTYATSGKSAPGGIPLSRKEAYHGCAGGTLTNAADFAWVTSTQPLVFITSRNKRLSTPFMTYSIPLIEASARPSVHAVLKIQRMEPTVGSTKLCGRHSLAEIVSRP